MFCVCVWTCPLKCPSYACMFCISFLFIETDSHSIVPDSLRSHALYSLWNSPGQNTGVGSRSFPQGIFPTQGSNPGLPHHRQILYQLSHQRSPRILEWVAFPFSSGSSWPRNQTGVSCIAGEFLTYWATSEAFFIAEEYFVAWLYHILFIHILVDWYLDYSHF